MAHQGEDPRESEVRQAGIDDEKVFSKSPFPRGLRALSLSELLFPKSLSSLISSHSHRKDHEKNKEIPTWDSIHLRQKYTQTKH